MVCNFSSRRAWPPLARVSVFVVSIYFAQLAPLVDTLQPPSPLPMSLIHLSRHVQWGRDRFVAMQEHDRENMRDEMDQKNRRLDSGQSLVYVKDRRNPITVHFAYII